MDCTYKTNKYGMPLLDIVGVTSANSTFYAGFVFLRSERQDSYAFAPRTVEDPKFDPPYQGQYYLAFGCSIGTSCACPFPF